MGVEETACGIGDSMKSMKKEALGIISICLAFFAGWAAHRWAVFKIISEFEKGDVLPVRDIWKMIA